ncbi:hypothetical protein [Gordonia soli]|nr:hypothetical protein [Gordonia soli]
MTTPTPEAEATPGDAIWNAVRPTLVDLWAWLYVGVSPAIAFATVYLSVASTSGGGDFCDPSYGSAAERDADFRTATLGIAIPSTIMLAVGAVLMVVILRSRHRFARWRTVRIVLALLALALTMAGYAYLLVVSDFTSDCG